MDVFLNRSMNSYGMDLFFVNKRFADLFVLECDSCNCASYRRTAVKNFGRGTSRYYYLYMILNRMCTKCNPLSF